MNTIKKYWKVLCLCIVGVLVVPNAIFWYFGMWDFALICIDRDFDTCLSREKRDFDTLVEKMRQGEYVYMKEFDKAYEIFKMRKFGEEKLFSAAERMKEIALVYEKYFPDFDNQPIIIINTQDAEFLLRESLTPKIKTEAPLKKRKGTLGLFSVEKMHKNWTPKGHSITGEITYKNLGEYDYVREMFLIFAMVKKASDLGYRNMRVLEVSASVSNGAEVLVVGFFSKADAYKTTKYKITAVLQD